MQRNCSATDTVVTLTVIADAGDVRLLDRYFDDQISRMMRVKGLVERLQPLANSKPASAKGLQPYTAKMQPEGVLRFETASKSYDVARQLGLSPGETFGLVLAWWRCHYLLGLPRTRPHNFGRRVQQFAAYRASQE